VVKGNRGEKERRGEDESWFWREGEEGAV